MKSNKTIVLTIVSIILSLSIGFCGGFFVGKNEKQIFKPKNSHEYSDKEMSMSIEKVEIIKLNYDYENDNQYKYIVKNETDYIDQYISNFENDYNLFIYYSFENKSDSPKSILNTVQIKLFSDGVALQSENNDTTIYKLYPDVWALCNNVNTEIQSGKRINACLSVKISQFKELLDKSLEININRVVKNDLSTKTELLKTINYTFSDIPMQEVTYQKDDKENYIIME